ncbi:MAG TPA: hypothetical protein VMV93_05965 [Chloroflexota bacterium]|nr:hypothetical protein [Chloroflexota bacterium]
MARDGVIACTSCGIGSRVGHAGIGWAKLEAACSGGHSIGGAALGIRAS